MTRGTKTVARAAAAAVAAVGIGAGLAVAAPAVASAAPCGFYTDAGGQAPGSGVTRF